MSDVGVFSARVEALIGHLLATRNLPEQRDGPNGGRSQVLEALMHDVQGRGTTSAREILSVLLGVDDSDARMVVRHCGIDVAHLVGWLGGARIPDPAMWISYSPSAAALKEANVVEVYEQAAAHMTAGAWELDPWPRRWVRLIAERARDVERGNAGRLASSRSKTLTTADKQRSNRAGAGLVPELARVAFAHAKARSLSATGQDDAKDPQYVLAVAACRAALALAQAHGLLSLQAQCHGLLGDLLRTTDRDAATIHARLGCDTAALLGDQSLFAFLLVTLGNAIAGDDPRSGSFNPDGYNTYQEHYERAAAILSRLGDHESSDMLLTTLELVRCATEAKATAPNNLASGELVHPAPDDFDDSPASRLRPSDQRGRSPVGISVVGSGGTESDAWLERFDGSALATLNRGIELSREGSTDAVSVEHLATASKAVLTSAPQDFDRMAEIIRVRAALASGLVFRPEAKTALMDSLRASITAKRTISARDVASATDKAQPC